MFPFPNHQFQLNFISHSSSLPLPMLFQLRELQPFSCRSWGMIALWSSKSKLVPDVESFLYIFFNISNSLWMMMLGLAVPGPVLVHPNSIFIKPQCLGWAAASCARGRRVSFVARVFIFRIVVERFDFFYFFLFFFSPVGLKCLRTILTWIKGDLLAALWLCFSAGSLTNSEKAIISSFSHFYFWDKRMAKISVLKNNCSWLLGKQKSITLIL